MDLKITQETQNPLFNRKEITGIIKLDNPPTKKEVAEELSKKFSTNPDTIRVVEIKGQFGVKEFHFKANIYEFKEKRDGIEIISKKEKDSQKPAEPEQKPEAPVEVKPVETNDSEKSEPKPAEAKPEEKLSEAPVEKTAEAPAQEKSEETNDSEKSEPNAKAKDSIRTEPKEAPVESDPEKAPEESPKSIEEKTHPDESPKA